MLSRRASRSAWSSWWCSPGGGSVDRAGPGRGRDGRITGAEPPAPSPRRPPAGMAGHRGTAGTGPGPAPSDPGLSGPVPNGPVLSDPVLRRLVLSRLVLRRLVLRRLVLSRLVLRRPAPTPGATAGRAPGGRP